MIAVDADELELTATMANQLFCGDIEGVLLHDSASFGRRNHALIF